jgi:hypothetical protein
MSKNSRKIVKILTLLFCEAGNIAGAKSSTDENSNLQLITRNSKSTSKVDKKQINWIKQNPIKASLFALFGIAGLSIGGVLIHNCLVNNKKDTEDKLLEVFGKIDKNNEFKNKWEALCHLLGEDTTKFVKENYPVWEKRLNCQSFRVDRRHLFSLMSIEYSLKLAAEENYNYLDKNNNNELLLGKDLGKIELEKNAHTHEDRLKKVIVEDEDILRSAHRFILKNPQFLNCFGILNAGSPYRPNGGLEWGCNALEEYLSQTTTLVRDLSGKAFKADDKNKDQGFYMEEKDYPPACCSGDDENAVMKKLQRDFYYERGIMSRNVSLIRSLGDINQNYRSDKTFLWNNPSKTFAEFNPPKNGIGAVKFRVLSIVGLEDATRGILDKYGKESKIYKKWEEVTKIQCEFVLKAFIKEKVKVPFLCAFSAGAFGGKASMVAKCFKELLIDEGYIDYFDYVVFPIGYSEANFKAFKNEFSKK